MLIADFDWDQVFTKALIGGVIGGVAGLVVYLVKKLGGGKHDSGGV